MKKIIFVLFAVCLLLSCEKLDMTGEYETDQVSLTVNVFRIEQTPFASLTRTEVKNACTRLNYAIYDLDGTRVKQINQLVSEPNFGTASFQLEKGKYLMVVVGHSCNGNPTMTDPNKIQFTNSTGYSDTFLYSETVTIGEEPVELDISLDRIVSLCRFVITDDIPADVAKMQFYYTGGSGAFNASTGLGSVNSKQTVTYSVSGDQKQFDLYTFLHATEGTIELKVSALDAKDNILRERDFSVKLAQNQISWLSGPFFDSFSSSASAISSIDVHTDWSAEHHYSF